MVDERAFEKTPSPVDLTCDEDHDGEPTKARPLDEIEALATAMGKPTDDAFPVVRWKADNGSAETTVPMPDDIRTIALRESLPSDDTTPVFPFEGESMLGDDDILEEPAPHQEVLAFSSDERRSSVSDLVLIPLTAGRSKAWWGIASAAALLVIIGFALSSSAPSAPGTPRTTETVAAHGLETTSVALRAVPQAPEAIKPYLRNSFMRPKPRLIRDVPF